MAAGALALAIAAVTVFRNSIAIVSGPTPPGTGLKAPATCSTSGCTSPMVIAPRRSNVSRRFEPAANKRSTEWWSKHKASALMRLSAYVSKRPMQGRAKRPKCWLTERL